MILGSNPSSGKRNLLRKVLGSTYSYKEKVVVIPLEQSGKTCELRNPPPSSADIKNE
jgi:hypothetical protein